MLRDHSGICSAMWRKLGNDLKHRRRDKWASTHILHKWFINVNECKRKEMIHIYWQGVAHILERSEVLGQLFIIGLDLTPSSYTNIFSSPSISIQLLPFLCCLLSTFHLLVFCVHYSLFPNSHLFLSINQHIFPYACLPWLFLILCHNCFLFWHEYSSGIISHYSIYHDYTLHCAYCTCSAICLWLVSVWPCVVFFSCLLFQFLLSACLYFAASLLALMLFSFLFVFFLSVVFCQPASLLSFALTFLPSLALSSCLPSFPSASRVSEPMVVCATHPPASHSAPSFLRQYAGHLGRTALRREPGGGLERDRAYLSLHRTGSLGTHTHICMHAQL